MNIERIDVYGSRLDAAERALALTGRCAWQTGAGLPGIEFCAVELTGAQRAAGQLWCDEHERAAAQDYGRAVVRLAELEVVPGTCSQCQPGHDRGDGRCERHGKEIRRG